jgi:hypothetical protein
MAGLIAALALAAAAQPAARPWICARNFAAGESSGLAAQSIAPDGRVSGVDVQVWTVGRGAPRLHWTIPSGSRFAPPRYFSWEIVIPPPTGPLWMRFWGDGRFLGQAPLVGPRLPRRMRAQRMWSVSTGDPQILAGMMATQRREVEIVNGRGEAVARETVPLPPPSALRSAIEAEVDWLESVIRTRAEPCYEEPSDLDSI